MNFDAINPALCALASKLTGIESGCCVFEDAPRPRHNGRLAILSWITPGAPVGLDATEWAFASNADPLKEMTPSVGGPRTCTLQFAVESFAGWTKADVAINRARSLFRGPTALDALAAVGLALATVGPTTRAPYPDQDRMVARSLFEVVFNAVDMQTDTDGQTSYIATADVTGSVSSPDGTSVPASIQPTTAG